MSDQLPGYDKTQFSMWNIKGFVSALIVEEEENKHHLDDERISINDEKNEEHNKEVREAYIHDNEKKNAKWYVNRKGTPMHINRAMKLIIPRKILSREKGIKH